MKASLAPPELLILPPEDQALSKAASKRDLEGLSARAPAASSTALNAALMGLAQASQPGLIQALLAMSLPQWESRERAIIDALGHCISRNKLDLFSTLLPFCSAFDPALHRPLIRAAVSSFGLEPRFARALCERFGPQAREAALTEACSGVCAPAFALRLGREMFPQGPLDPQLRGLCVIAAQNGVYQLADHLAGLSDRQHAQRAVETAGPGRMPKTASGFDQIRTLRETAPIDPLVAAAALAKTNASRLAKASAAKPLRPNSRSSAAAGSRPEGPSNGSAPQRISAIKHALISLGLAKPR